MITYLFFDDVYTGDSYVSKCRTIDHKENGGGPLGMEAPPGAARALLCLLSSLQQAVCKRLKEEGAKHPSWLLEDRATQEHARHPSW